VLITSLTQVNAGESPENTDWEFNTTVYLWSLSLSGETNADDDIDIDFSDIWDNVNFAIMGYLTARHGRWLVFGDMQYADLEGDDNTTFNFNGQDVSADFDIEVKQWVVHAGGGYTVSKSEQHMTDIIAGVRYFYQDTELKFDSGQVQNLKVDDSADNLDAIIGIFNTLKLNETWYLNTYLDVGTGESEFTWQGVALLGYQFKSVDTVFGYRHIYWDFEGDKGLGKGYNDLDFSGPIVGASFKF
jgi:hypothetical protein